MFQIGGLQGPAGHRQRLDHRDIVKVRQRKRSRAGHVAGNIERSRLDHADHIAGIDRHIPLRIAALNQQGVLTVGDEPGFSWSGSVALVTVGRQIRFDVNTKAAAAGGVTLSSQLLRLAITVR